MVVAYIIYSKSQISLEKTLFSTSPLASLCSQVAIFIEEEHDFLKTFSINFFVINYAVQFKSCSEYIPNYLIPWRLNI